jgi:hypothetical protein
MPTLEYFLVCESVSTDQETNRLSAFNILEDIRLAPPINASGIISQLVAVACFNRDQGDENQDYQATIRIHNAEKNLENFPVNFRMDRPRHRLTLRFVGLPQLEPGQLRFELLLNGEHVAWHTVNVTSAEECPSRSGSGAS